MLFRIILCFKSSNRLNVLSWSHIFIIQFSSRDTNNFECNVMDNDFQIGNSKVQYSSLQKIKSDMFSIIFVNIARRKCTCNYIVLDIILLTLECFLYTHVFVIDFNWNFMVVVKSTFIHGISSVRPNKLTFLISSNFDIKRKKCRIQPSTSKMNTIHWIVICLIWNNFFIVFSYNITWLHSIN